MLGLKRHTVQLVAHQSDWKAHAAKHCQEIRHLCGELLVDVQHIGSTAVLDLPAKPILDLAIAIPTETLSQDLVQQLRKAGYIYRRNSADEGGYLFIKESLPEVRTVHLHVVQHGGKQWRNYLRFRDILNENASAREAYATVKQKLARAHPNDRQAYTAGKKAFIEKTLNNPRSGQEFQKCAGNCR